jgi:hypothetical protein
MRPFPASPAKDRYRFGQPIFTEDTELAETRETAIRLCSLARALSR